ncbi:MAG: hypothetical protein ACOX0F_13530, partial [Syntrophomonadaceae bacterium]
LGVLVAIAVPIYGSIGKTAANNAHDANVRILKGAGATYLVENPIPDTDLTVDTELDSFLETPLAEMKIPEKADKYIATGYSVVITANGKVQVSPSYTKETDGGETTGG